MTLPAKSGQSLSNGQYLTSLIDLTLYASEIREYALAYLDWLSEIKATLEENQDEALNLLKETPFFLGLDVVEVQMAFGLNETHKVLLLAPTHPLRMMWHLQYALVLQEWFSTASRHNKQTARQMLVNNINVQQLANGSFSSNNLPPMLPLQKTGAIKLFVDSGSLSHFWQLYLDPETKDSRSIRSHLEQLLGLARPGSRGVTTTNNPDDVGKEELTRKILRYLYQHPYVDTLKVNVFNPGDAHLLVECLLELQKQYPDLRYQVRLFSEQVVEGTDIGQSIEDLVNPQRQVSEDHDEFVITSRNHLFPKLKFSRNSTVEYLRNAEAYDAHLSLLFNLC